jgi:hypothetical protein
MNLDNRQKIINRNIALLSKDPSTQVSATLYSQHGSLIAVGYNGLPRGFNDGIQFTRELENLEPFITLFKQGEFEDHQFCTFVDAINEIIDGRLTIGLDGQVYLRDESHKLFADRLVQAITPTMGRFLNRADLSNITPYRYYKYDFFEHAERNLIYNYVRAQVNNDNLMAIVSDIHSPEDVRALIGMGVKTIYIENDFSLDCSIEEAHHRLSVLKMLQLARFRGVEWQRSDIFYKAKQYANIFRKTANEINEQEQSQVTDFCAILKKDFSVLSLGFNGVNQYIDYHLKSHKGDAQSTDLQAPVLSATLNAVYDISNHYMANKNFKMIVSLYSCKHCLNAVMASGIDVLEIDINTNSSTATTNLARWKKEFEENSVVYNKYVLSKL